MPRWWKRLIEMPDGQRARKLAWVAASALILLLYGLGGVGLMLRNRYILPAETPVGAAPSGASPDPRPASPDALAGSPKPTAAPNPAMQPSPTRTLYPTITPALVVPASS
jgi:hypothetical protein